MDNRKTWLAVLALLALLALLARKPSRKVISSEVGDVTTSIQEPGLDLSELIEALESGIPGFNPVEGGACTGFEYGSGKPAPGTWKKNASF
jgi:methyl coenzyme M reductase subunit C